MLGLVNRKHGYPEQLVEWLTPLFNTSVSFLREVQLSEQNRILQKQEETNRTIIESASRAKSTFLAYISHELRTALSGILGMIEIIDFSHPREDDRNNLTMAANCGHSLLTLLNDLLDVSKIEQGQLLLEEIPFSPQKVVNETMKLLSIHSFNKDVARTVSMDQHIPSVLVGDPTRLKQILLNLITNSIKFTFKGYITIEIFGASSESNSTSYCLEGKVTDTGIGMSPETLSRIFLSFTQADTSIIRRFGGSGLGLFITKQLCEMMGGSIEVTSAIGEGSTFHFKVHTSLPKDGQVFNAQQKSRGKFRQLPKMSVLIVEDSEVNQAILKRMLAQSGCTLVTIVPNGCDAISRLHEEDYDMILMDGEMPEMDGLEATKIIRKTISAVIPIIGITANAMIEDLEKFMEAGINSYLTKPFTRDELVLEILKYVQGNKDTHRES